MGRQPKKELPGQKIFSVNESPTGEYTAQVRTTLKGKMYGSFFSYMRDNELREADAARYLMKHGLIALGLWKK